jgi:maltose/moltooligosaccharide transporter
MVGVGIAWASILSLPYAMLAQAVPARKMGIYMGIFNFFIVIPQILAASVLGILVRVLFGGQSIDALVLGGTLMILAGLATLRVDDQGKRVTGSV